MPRQVSFCIQNVRGLNTKGRSAQNLEEQNPMTMNRSDLGYSAWRMTSASWNKVEGALVCMILRGTCDQSLQKRA